MKMMDFKQSLVRCPLKIIRVAIKMFVPLLRHYSNLMIKARKIYILVKIKRRHKKLVLNNKKIKTKMTDSYSK